MFNPEFLTTTVKRSTVNLLIQVFWQEQSPDVALAVPRFGQLAILQGHHVATTACKACLGMIPSEQFEVEDSSQPDNLGGLDLLRFGD